MQNDDDIDHSSDVSSIGELALLPIFLKLTGERVLVLGGSDAAAWKAELLTAAGARVEVFSEKFSEKMQKLSLRCRLIPRNWRREDLMPARLIVADAVGQAALDIRATAKELAIPMNLIDQPWGCDFQFGAIVERSPVVIGISSDGVAPVLSQTIRARIETLLPQHLRNWAKSAFGWRKKLAELNLSMRERRHVWSVFAKKALAFDAALPTEESLAELLENMPFDKGRVTLVGAGPGDPELLTLKAVRALQAADVVLYDDLVAREVLHLARREAERIYVGKRGYKPSCTQEDISSLSVERALRGQHVVRLKGGDPSIFGRSNEEIAALSAANITVEIVPGVTAVSASAAALGVSLTERDSTRRVQFVTGHGREGNLPNDLDWRALADPKATTCVYMGMKSLPELVEKLLQAGLPSQTSAAIVEWASWPQQRILRSNLADLPREAAEWHGRGPGLIVIGQVLAALEQFSIK